MSNKSSKKQVKTKPPRLRYNWRKIWKYIIDFAQSWNLVKIVIPIEIILNLYIIQTVSYTEIDWSTYMVQVQHIFNGTLDYAKIEGPTGPLVYPAGHVWFFSILYGLTNGGTNILLAQLVYACIYIANLVVLYKIYSHHRVKHVPPYMFLIMCFTSRRIHSIYVLRLFNDPVAMMFAYMSFYALLEKKYTISSALFSVALSIKMNILLFAPAFALILHEQIGLINSIKNALIFISIQILLGLPFLISQPMNYLNGAFNFGRVFLHQWTVNWRFLPEKIFVNQNFAITLLVLQTILILVFFWSRWRRVVCRLFCIKRQTEIRRDDPMVTLAVINFIGVACSRSLHYQFYVWYYHTLPLLLWSTEFSTVKRFLLLGLIEFAWNTYPSTIASSIILHSCHIAILYGLYHRQGLQQASQLGGDQLQNPIVKKIRNSNNKLAGSPQPLDGESGSKKVRFQS